LTETTDVRSDATDASTADVSDSATAGSRPRRRQAGLAGMVLPELQELAASLGITGTARMRKGDLVAAIKEKQGETSVTSEPAAPAAKTRRAARRPAGTPTASADDAPAVPAETNGFTPAAEPAVNGNGTARRGRRRVVSEDAPTLDSVASNDDRAAAASAEPAAAKTDQPAKQTDSQSTDSGSDNSEGGRRDNNYRQRNDNRNRDGGENRNREGGENRNRDGGDNRNRDGGDNRNRDDDYDSNRRRGRRFRDRRGRGGSGRERTNEAPEPVIAEDDVLIPVAGILDVLDNYAFIRTSGYLTGPNDVYVSLSQVRKNGLRRGDAVTGAVRQPREGERRDKYNALVRLDTVNGLEPEEAKKRPEFHKLTPLYPQERLRLETEPHHLITRVIDLVMPIGKGQRALIVSPPKAGKTTVLQSIANAITTNNPECHLMIVLVDERPEEVTDMQRSVKGEVIASTFDRPPQDHTTISELAIERAKRLVELGHDVVVMLDSITRLGRAYNLAAPASGRILSGGVDSTALYPPKRFLGAARNIENGGSLTIFGTALVETGSTADTVIFEEFKATGNAELKLDRGMANKRIFPAVDLDASSTRKEEILLSPDELAIVIKLRRVLAALDTQQALELVLNQLRKTRTNVEFLMQVQKTMPGAED
jgi:transcription termination factor Rho